MALDVLFHVDLPHGRCVGVRVPPRITEAMLTDLSVEERALLDGMAPACRSGWLAGRCALHSALAEIGLATPTILALDSGAPRLPEGAMGSISHKQTLAVALAAPKQPGMNLGVDLEVVPTEPPTRVDPAWDRRPDISRRVMTPTELAALEGISDPERRRSVLLCFSIKEALYKALNPALRRYVSFQEASVRPMADGRVEVTLALKQKDGPFVAEARWAEISGHLLTTARIWPAGH